MRTLTNRCVLAAAVVGLVVGATGRAGAAPITFFGEDPGLGESVRLSSHPNSDAASNQFQAQLTGVGTETFESFPGGTGLPVTLTFSGAGTATLTDGGSGSTIESVPTGTNGVGRYPISGNNYLETSTSGLTATFSSPEAAFGFYATDLGDFGGTLTLTLTHVGGATELVNVPNAVNVLGGSALFFGLIDASNPFTGVVFGNTAAGTDGFGFDNLTIGSPQQVVPAVPEPATMATGITGVLLCLGYA